MRCNNKKQSLKINAKNVRRASIIAILFICNLSTLAMAQELQENFVPVRPLGMGGAFNAVANDEAAIWTNPAGIARARKSRTRNYFMINMPNFSVGANSKARKIYSANNGNSGELADTIAANADLQTDSPAWTNFAASPVALFDYSRNWVGGFGLFSTTVAKIVIQSDEPDNARTNFVSDQGVTKNLTWTNTANRFSIGMQMRYISRYAFEDTIPTASLQNKGQLQELVTSGANSLTGVGVDVGIMMTLADFWFPTLGVSVLNLPTGCKEDYLNPHSKKRETICGNLFQGTIVNEDALSVIDPTDVRVGFAITPRTSNKTAVRLAADLHHLAITSGTQYYGTPGIAANKLLHLGAEFFVGNPLQQSPFSLRLGSNQGFMTSGFTLNLGILAFDFATYGVDVSSTSKTIEDRRYVGSVSTVF